MGFPADNPGLWLMHCHIPWHVGQGLSLQFLERKDEILGKLGELGDYQKTCDSWKEWWNRPDRPYQDGRFGVVRHIIDRVWVYRIGWMGLRFAFVWRGLERHLGTRLRCGLVFVGRGMDTTARCIQNR